jgi:hypothetical protein
MYNDLIFQLEMTKSNTYTLKILQEDKTVYLHSKYNPTKEAENWAQSFYEPGKLFIMIGDGLGYYSKALVAQMCDDDNLLIIEPSKQIFKLAVDNMGMRIIEDKRVLFAFAEEGENLQIVCRLLMKRQLFTKTKIAIAPNYDKFFSVDKIVEKLQNIIVGYNSDIITRSSFAKEWQENYLQSIEYAVNSCPVAQFINKFNVPAIIVAAGPSLTCELENLKKLYNRALIICAGSAAPVLIRNNIIPHLIVSIDGGIFNYHHFKDINFENIPLFYSPTIHHEILKTHLGAKVVFQWSSNIITDWYNETIGFETGIVKVGPSVANSALDLACKMTSGPICFVGQDLGFTDGYSHAEGNNNRSNLNDIRKHMRVKKIESNDGSELWSDYGYILMRDWFENYLYTHPRDNVYNTAIKGARINGTTVIDFGEFIGQYCGTESNIKKEIDDILEVWNQSKSERIVTAEDLCKHMLLCLDQLIELTSKSLTLSKKLLNKVKNDDFVNINKILNKISALDEKIKALKDKDGLFHFLMQPLNDKMDAWDQEENDNFRKALQIAEKNYFFYSELYKISQEARKIVVNTSLFNSV